MDKDVGKKLLVNTTRNFLITLNNLKQLHAKLLQKRAIQETAEANVI